MSVGSPKAFRAAYTFLCKKNERNKMIGFSYPRNIADRVLRKNFGKNRLAKHYLVYH